jgi:protein involved in polysaccharide export with SLBB domain
MTTMAFGLLIAMVPQAASAQKPVPVATIAANDLSIASTVLKPGDMLRLRIWKEPDFSGDYLIDEHGMAVLPRLGLTSVADIPAAQLRDQLTEQYREYLNNPTIEVTPLRRISIVGAVRNPGVYRIEPGVTLGEVINVAGGPSTQSKRNVVELRRGAEQRTVDLEHHPELATLTLASNDQVYVPERSWLNQNATWFVSTLVGIGGTIVFLVTR